MAAAPTAQAPASPWDNTEPNCDEAPCYSKHLKADLLPGTFVLLSTRADQSNHDSGVGVVARIVAVVTSSPSTVTVNIFKKLKEVQPTGGFLYPPPLEGNNLRYLQEIVQTPELRVVEKEDIINLSFVFTPSSLQDTTNLFFTCQGMARAFLLRFRFNEGDAGPLSEVPRGCCLPFPSGYERSRYDECFPRRVWHHMISIKMALCKLLGRYSQQHGLFSRERSCLTNITAETWGFLVRQFSDLAFATPQGGKSTRLKIHRITESGLVVKAARIEKSCTLMRFETKTQLRRLCNVFGESVTAGQRCRLPKIASPVYDRGERRAL